MSSSPGSPDPRRARLGRTSAALALTLAAAASLVAGAAAAGATPPPPPAAPVIASTGCSISMSATGYDSLEMEVVGSQGLVLGYAAGPGDALNLDYGQYVTTPGQTVKVYAYGHLGATSTETTADVVPVCDKGATIAVTEQVMGTPLPTSTFGISLSQAATEAECDTSGADVVGNAPVAAGGSVTFNVLPGVHYCLRESSYDGALSDVTAPQFVQPTVGTPHLTATNVSEFRGAVLAPTLAWVKDGVPLPTPPPGLDKGTFSLRADVTDHDGKLVRQGSCDYGAGGLDCENLGLPLGSTAHFTLEGAPAGWTLSTDITGADCAGIPDMGTCAPALTAHLGSPPPTTIPVTTPPTTVPAKPPATAAPAAKPTAVAAQTVAAAAPADPNAPVTSLPRTGANTVWLAWLAARILVLGGAFLVLRRWLAGREDRMRRATGASTAPPLTTLVKEQDR
jgi:LPXTG-motif cell wall-anchored protein